ncbi:hypothetical protein LTR10_014517 [Elasticomyces elasticus]|uniref:Uncharacterized protein n=1 Tax=Exophiala sideris TaxID=1016849 RepID=A0ABR0JSD1_9EURO|nr:hypothetical protein LTR10_014517 [Elasticomyces elasticus]KAK5040496.1 hypothetical protein LTS07_000994 [Exophiala sideris]KAK5043078.1 hypothetical protein LTR13_000849 [Exophiala sideris]KAK5068874.1 hypothetical protein LTR69_000995 [Exophiala sideris]KAK5186470.1 hypothetical protein LTR44_001526 [Eurotiomycetes sp. CCFEE 6388]
MAPPENTFPVSSLEQRAQFHSVNFKDKSRKLGDFDLKRDCELLELVQYSCTTPEQQAKRAMESPDGRARMECFPFVRLFRKCENKGKVFHVETTAWEGQNAWKPPAGSRPTAGMSNKEETAVYTESTKSVFAKYKELFWFGE